MLKRREGFTLIELLIVIVIIGILAAIAIPKFGKTREKAYYKAMMSDLRNLQAQEEVYYSNPQSNYNYTATIGTTGVDISPSQGVTIAIGNVAQTGWSASATHAGLNNDPAHQCAIYVGVTPAAPAATQGVVACSE